MVQTEKGKIDLYDYISQEMKRWGRREDVLLDKEEVKQRLRLTDRGLMNARLGRNIQGVRLECIRLTKKTIRYTVQDVLAYEWQCRD